MAKHRYVHKIVTIGNPACHGNVTRQEVLHFMSYRLMGNNHDTISHTTAADRADNTKTLR